MRKGDACGNRKRKKIFFVPSSKKAVRIYRKQLEMVQKLKEGRSLACVQILPGSRILFREAIGEVIRLLRKEKEMTLKDVSQEAGISIGYLSEVERGNKEMTSVTMESVSKALGVTLSDILKCVCQILDGPTAA